MATHAKAHIFHSSHTPFHTGPHLALTPGEELKAPPGKYRVMAAGAPGGLSGNCLLGDFTNLRAAMEIARAHGLRTNPAIIYDDRGAVLARFES